MVFVAPENTAAENFDSYEKYFKFFSFELSIWQKYAIRAIVDGDHCLVTAPTGSGKTTPAEFAIEYFKTKQKKVIYTSPIKALSNQKYYEFTQKYPAISFGILTGDIKDNPEADVLIMTTEILRNNLYQRELSNKGVSNIPSLDFNIDIENDVGAIVFDEVHYINDADRGTVWEECFMLTPATVQFIMLSATIDKPHVFAKWVEDIKKQKQVVLTPCSIRAVPLEHYLWLTVNSSDIKKIKDPKMKSFIENNSNCLSLVKKGKTPFMQESYSKVKKVKNYIEKNRMNPRKSGVLNQVVKYLKNNTLLPAICFVYSRRNVENYASEITAKLHTDPKNAQIVRKECEKILMKLSNYKEFILLPEFTFMVGLLEKGIAIHHSGIIPILREMVEILFSKGFVQLLFATETFSVGLNMPTKTVIFTDVNKFDGTDMRYLYSHEYTQQAGRAGRRGFDTKGVVIHLNNLFDLPSTSDYEKMLSNTPDKLTSKFKMSFNFLLNALPVYQDSILEYTGSSMIINDLTNEVNRFNLEISNVENKKKEYDNLIKKLKTSESIINDIRESESKLEYANNKTKKKLLAHIKATKTLHPTLYEDTEIIEHHKYLCKHLYSLKTELSEIKNYINDGIERLKQYLLDNMFIEVIPETSFIGLTHIGHIAANLKEVHGLAMSDTMHKTDNFSNLDYVELAGVFSCFTSISIKDDKKCVSIPKCRDVLFNTIDNLQDEYDRHFNNESKYNLSTGEDYNIHYDLILYVMEWCKCTNEQSCKELVQKIYYEKEIFLGEFIKAILKINNITSEVEDIAELINDMELLTKCKKIQENTLKYIAINQSLYI